MNFKNYISVLIVLITVGMKSFGQAKGNDWFTIPGFEPDSPLTLTSQETFIGAVGLAAISYTLAEFILKQEENVNYYQLRTGMNKEYGWGLREVWHQNFGVEHRVAKWFSLSAEFNLQEYLDSSPNLSGDKKFGLGVGLMTYYRWYLMGKKRVSPYFEYGTGVFYAFNKFPYNGNNFTFNDSTQVGVEYTLKKGNKVRLGYGNFHQSNFGWLESNPAHNGNGFSVTYAWKF